MAGSWDKWQGSWDGLAAGSWNRWQAAGTSGRAAGIDSRQLEQVAGSWDRWQGSWDRQQAAGTGGRQLGQVAGSQDWQHLLKNSETS
jgi:hypothetical protein